MKLQIYLCCVHHIIILLIVSFGWKSTSSSQVNQFDVDYAKTKFREVFGVDDGDEHEYNGFDYIHDYMLTLYNTHSKKWPDNMKIKFNTDLKYFGRIDKIKSHLPINISSDENIVHRFNLSRTAGDQDHEHIASEFRIRIDASKHTKNLSVSVTLEDFSHDNGPIYSTHISNSQRDFIKLKKVDHNLNNTEWLSFDVTKFIKKLQKSRNRLAVFHVYLEYEDVDSGHRKLVKRSISHAPITPQTAKSQSHLVTYMRRKTLDINHSPLDDKDRKVLKRSQRSADQNNNHKMKTTLTRKKRKIRHDRSNRAVYYRDMLYNLCQIRSLYVDFEKTEWRRWIYAPPGYHAGYCSGVCPFPLAKHYNSTNHAIIQLLMHTKHPDRVPPPCCVPHEYESRSMLIFYMGEAMLLRLNQMVVSSCACQ